MSKIQDHPPPLSVTLLSRELNKDKIKTLMPHEMPEIAEPDLILVDGESKILLPTQAAPKPELPMTDKNFFDSRRNRVANKAMQLQKPDWYEMSKKFVTNKYEQEAAMKQLNVQLWLSAPSVLYGPPGDIFRGVENQISLDESVNMFHFDFDEHAFKGLGLTLGDPCFFGLKAIEREKLERAAREGDTIPFFGLLSCEF